MRYCKKCVMPDTRPGIVFDDEGVCAACRSEERKDKTDWDARWKELEALCDKHRGMHGNSYDCIIAVSGGKDSHMQTYVMKEQMNMNPLLVTVEDNYKMTKAGMHNLKNISEAYGCDIISMKPNLKAQKILTRKAFELHAMPAWHVDRLIYTFPIHIAIRFNIPLIVYGENVGYEYGGYQKDETYSAKAQIENDVAPDFVEEMIDDQVTAKDMALCFYPSPDEIEAAKLEPIYMSYFRRWNDWGNYVLAKKHGFRDLVGEWRREHVIDDHQQVDSYAYILDPWLKYPKFGHAIATDMASRLIRYGKITREEGIKLVKKHDHRLDQKALEDFCNFCGYTTRQFWEILDKFYNRDLFEKNKFGEWVLKDPIWEQNS